MRTAIATAALAAAAGLTPGWAHALTLGGMTVQSNLGEPLRAEVQVFDLTPAESASLTVQPASAAAFQAAGIEYSGALAGMQVSIDRRGTAQAVVRITGNRAVNEPFLEVLLEANWAGGRLSRNYTLLLDPPPAGRRTAPPAPLAPQIAAPAPAPVQAPAARPIQPSPPVVVAPAAPVAPPPVVAARPVAPRPVPAPRPPAAGTGGGGQVTVRPGDTAGRIANNARPASVSLDQMLVAMLQSNPDAFLGGNVNRIRAGAVLNMPSGADAAAVPAGEARQTVVAQSRDFNEFRRRLAAGAPAVASAAPQGQASGSVQTRVEDRRPAATTPDRLTLSKGTVDAQAAAEAERVARANQERDSAQRLAELSRNVNELNRLGAATGSNATVAPPPAAIASPPASAPPAAAPVVEAPAAAPPADAPAATAPAPATSVAPAAAPAAPVAPVAPVVAPPAPTSASFLDDSPLGDPKILGIVGLLVALVVALVSYRTIRRRRAPDTDGGFAGKNGPDSFFGASGGQQINTLDAGPSILATSYSPSQLDAGGEVDPIAEADVYLAYGRELQAEDILKEALRNQPERTALHAKLAEIYAKRRDVAAFTALATDAHRLTGGIGADWARIRALGEELDPSHPLFDDVPVTAAVAGVGAAGVAAAAAALTAAPESRPEPHEQNLADAGGVEDTPASDDISLDFDPYPEPEPDRPATRQADPDPDTELPPSLELDFGAFTPDAAAPPPADAPAPTAAPAGDDPDDFGLDFDLGDFAGPGSAAPASAAPGVPDREPLPPLDLSGFSLDLDDAPTPEPSAPPAPATPPEPTADTVTADADDLPEVGADDALATKLALADEFNAIGDVDGARHLIEEVIAEASGSVRERAERMLDALR